MLSKVGVLGLIMAITIRVINLALAESSDSLFHVLAEGDFLFARGYQIPHRAPEPSLILLQTVYHGH